MVFRSFKIFKRRDKRAQAGGSTELHQTQADTVDNNCTIERLQTASPDRANQKCSKQQRIHWEDVSVIQANLHEKLTLIDNTRDVDIIEKQVPTIELEQDTADNLFVKTLAETINEIEQDEFQLHARLTHLNYLQYYTLWQKNSVYYKKLLDKYRHYNMGLTPDKNRTRTTTTEQ